MEFSFDAEVIHWRGPAPYFYAPLPAGAAEQIRSASKLVSYGWGVIPVTATVGGVPFTTSLFPRDGTYLLPLKDAVRRPTGITAGDVVHIEMTVQPRR
jgi:hypothetical protein